MRVSTRACRRNRGFTLIELLVVIVILATLLAIAVPTYLSQQTKAKDSEVEQYLTTGYRIAKGETVGNNGYYPSVSSLVDAIASSEPEFTVSSGQCSSSTGPSNLIVSSASTATMVVLCAKSQSGRVWEVSDNGTGSPATSRLDYEIDPPVQRFSQNLIAQAGSSSFSPASTIQAGTTAFILITASATKTPTTITDSVGNSWNIQVADTENIASAGRVNAIATAHITTPVTSADTISITWSSAASGNTRILIEEVSESGASSLLDQHSTAQAVGQTPTTGVTGNLSANQEIVWFLFGYNPQAAGPTTDSSWTTIFSGTNSLVAYKIVWTASPVSGTGTIPGANNTDWVATVAAFRPS